MHGTLAPLAHPMFPAASLALANHVHAVDIGEDIVFLDVIEDAYLCLVGAAHEVRLTPEGGVQLLVPSAGETLREAGLVGDDQLSPRREPPPKPTVDLPVADRRPTGRDVAALAGACWATSRAFRTSSFARIISEVAAGRAGSATPTHDLLEASAIFARLRPWSPVGGVCLKRSHLQLQYLRRLGFEADWVIGVRTWPFMAHCWLQAGDVALDEDVERLVAYTPILVI